MARKLRLQFDGAVYHVINRGNFRRDVFETADKARAFEACLFEAAERLGWRLHAYVLMSNHYHLAVETPEANLVEGMHWLQSTFATRFNRFRRERGHLFQGRYQALVIEPGPALGWVVSYIHLNPVRAGIVPAESVMEFRWSSLNRLMGKEAPPPCLSAKTWLGLLGVSDDTAGWNSYVNYLARLAGDNEAQKEQGFAEMSRGWAIGTDGWRKALATEHAQLSISKGVPHQELAELKRTQWELALADLMKQAGRTSAEAAGERKGATWKVALAAEMRRKTSASNPWIAEALHMGSGNAVSQYLSRVKAGKDVNSIN
jgi:REP element-mobilizing transposase RayT